MNRLADPEPFYYQIRSYLQDGVIPDGDKFQQRMFVLRASPYTIIQYVLYKEGLDRKLRRCVTKEEALRVMHTFHSSEEGGHFGTETIIKKIRVAGYWWSALHKDVKDYIHSCGPC